MDEHFSRINKRAFARAIRLHLAMKAQEILELTESQDFESAFLNDPGDPTVDKLIVFKDFYNDVVVHAWVTLKQQADTPDEIEGLYTYLASKGVSFGA